jgi:ubiquinone/menaquinone biosynthesis C-methylase UbiE
VLKANISRVLDQNSFLQRFYRMNFVKMMEATIVLQFLVPKKGETIADIACGRGLHSIELLKRGCQVFGMDKDKYSIEVAKSIAQRHGCHLLVGEVTNLPYRTNSFDKIICISSLEHFENDEKALREMNRVLKDDGTIVLTVDSFTYRGIRSHLKETHKNLFHVVNYYSLSQLKEKMKNAGFKIKRHKYFVNSSISAFFFDIMIKDRLGLLSAAIFVIAYIFSSISDRFMGKQDEGYFLAVKAKKC